MATESKIKEDSVAVPVAQGDLDAVSNGTFYNPHEVLGGHLGPDEHEQAEQEQERRPQIGEGGDGLKPRGGQDRHDLERALPQRLGSVAADALA